MLPFFSRQPAPALRVRAVACAAAFAALAGVTAFHPEGARGALAAAGTVMSCSLSTACWTETNLAAGSALSGVSKGGPGVSASSTSGTALVATSGTGTGAITQSRAQTGLEVYNAGSTAGADLYALDSTPGGNAIYAISKRGIAAYFENTSNAGVADTDVAVVARSGTAGMRSPVLDVADARNTAVASFDDSGNLTLAGEIFSAGDCSQGCARTRRVVTYAPRETLPVAEDAGEATLVRGRAEVRLDPAFANIVDLREPYLVTLTPEGESRGLFVAARTPRGFSVREAQGGTSEIAFAYRISAKPIGSRAPRLPLVDIAAPEHAPHR
jgi:hypothetical protein